MSKSIDRRGFGRICAGLAAVAVTGTGRLAQAADLPHVDEAGPQAQALGYVHDASKVDKVKFPGYVAGSICGGCQLYQGGTAEWGPCALFAGSAVNTKGWCSAFAKKA
jgi:High potential iron-sulfur protein